MNTAADKTVKGTEPCPDYPAIVAQLHQTIEDLRRENRLLNEKLQYLLHQRYGRKSESFMDARQGQLFEMDPSITAEEEPPAPTEIEPKPSRRKGGRRRPPKELPRIRIEHDLEESEKRCRCGEELHRIGEVVTEQYDVVLPRFQVLEHVQFKYACPCCDQGIKVSPKAPEPLPRTQASPGLLAWLGACKFADGQPLYRQSKILKQRFGVSFSRTTLAAWMIGASDRILVPLLTLMEGHLLSADYLHVDETVFQVLDEPGRKPWQKSFLWARVSATGPPIIRLDYHHSRSGAVADRLLTGFSGYLQTDGYCGYNGVAARDDVVQLGCWSHVRRKFDAVIKSNGRHGPQADLARAALGYIRQLYAVEKSLKGRPIEEIHEKRQEASKEVLDQLHEWKETHLGRAAVLGGSIAKAFTYLHNQWPKLVRFLEDGRLQLDNNRAERHIRPIAVGRKNWIFCQSQEGAHATAAWYSVVETARANGWDSFHYLHFLFKEAPRFLQQNLSLEPLLPWNVRQEDVLD